MPWTAQRDNFHNRRSVWITLVGRLKPGVSQAQAQASLSTLWHSLHGQELSPLHLSHTLAHQALFSFETHRQG